MKKINLITAGLIAIMSIAVSGCQVKQDSVSLIEAPKLSDNKQEDIKTALYNLLPSGAEYAIAKNSQLKESILTADINNDGKQEGIVLYYDVKENHPVHILVLKANSGSWVKAADISTEYNYLDYFNLVDLNGDGKKEVVAGVGITDTDSKKKLLIYEFNEDTLKNMVDTEYEWVGVDDFDGDNKPDILMLTGEVPTSQTAKLYHYDKGELTEISSVNLTPDAYHENIVSGLLSDGNKAVFIDSGCGAHSMLTEIVAFNKGKLIKIGNLYDDILFKEYPLYSTDINQDGIIEVGGMYIPKGYEDAAFAEIPFIYTYNDFQIDGTSQVIEQRYGDNTHNFYITIPVEWYNKVTVERIEHGVRLVSTEDKTILFEVKWSDKASYNGNGIKLGETKDTQLYTDYKEATPISKDNFHMLGEDF